MASSAQSEQDQYADEGGGFQIIKVWMENNSGAVPSQDDLAGMANDYGMTGVPNLADDSNTWALYENDYGIPSVAFIGPDMTVLAVDTYTQTPSTYIE